jgi:hypothetical protein
MLPQAFLEFAREFSYGFLAVVENRVPVIHLVEFKVRPEYIIVNLSKEGPACLVFANERYSENSKMAQVTGELVVREGECRLIPRRAYWTYPFSLSAYPREIVKRWYRR